MKKENYILIFITALFLIGSSFLTAQTATNFSKQELSRQAIKFNKSVKKIDNHINEVYANNAVELVFNTPTRYKAIKDVYTRFFIIERDSKEGEKYIKLSSIALNDKHNSNLNRNIVFNPKQFNPLKYKLDFFPKLSTIYRVDNTNYILLILPEI